jgi:hypothetical protein
MFYLVPQNRPSQYSHLDGTRHASLSFDSMWLVAWHSFHKLTGGFIPIDSFTNVVHGMFSFSTVEFNPKTIIDILYIVILR